jgi:predicted transglutaminase-like cysteine proteinase
MGQASPGCTGTRSKSRRGTPVALIVAALLLVLSQGRLTTPAKAQAEADAFLPRAPPLAISNEVAEPTAAWMSFCERLPAECAINQSEPEAISLTPDLWQTLASINERVNTTIKPISDQQHWGVVDRWDYPDDGSGDCEDIQLLKRKLLIEAGLPRRALRMTVVLDRAWAGHAVLMVRTNRGDFILDNEQRAILAWSETGYAFIKREGAEGRTWVTLSPHPAPIVTANR